MLFFIKRIYVLLIFSLKFLFLFKFWHLLNLFINESIYSSFYFCLFIYLFII